MVRQSCLYFEIEEVAAAEDLLARPMAPSSSDMVGMVDGHLRCCLGCSGSHWGRTIAGKGAAVGREVVAGMRAAVVGREAAVSGKQEAAAEVVVVVVVAAEVAGTAAAGSSSAALAGAEEEPGPEDWRRDSLEPLRAGGKSMKKVRSRDIPAMD